MRLAMLSLRLSSIDSVVEDDGVNVNVRSDVRVSVTRLEREGVCRMLSVSERTNVRVDVWLRVHSRVSVAVVVSVCSSDLLSVILSSTLADGVAEMFAVNVSMAVDETGAGKLRVSWLDELVTDPLGASLVLRNENSSLCVTAATVLTVTLSMSLQVMVSVLEAVVLLATALIDSLLEGGVSVAHVEVLDTAAVRVPDCVSLGSVCKVNVTESVAW